jgi:hypothetical protein
MEIEVPFFGKKEAPRLPNSVVYPSSGALYQEFPPSHPYSLSAVKGIVKKG